MNARILILFAILASVSICSGQVVTSNEDCPTVVIAGPLVAVKDGDTAIFTALLTGDFDRKKIAYQWSLDNGQIVSGQGTDEINVTVSGKPTATVNVSGFEEGCNGTVSLPAPYGDVKPSVIFFDEFGKVKDKLLERRIAALVDTLRRNPTTYALIITYGSADAVRKREIEIRDLALGISSSIDPLRIVFANGGVEKDVRTRVWIVPPGVDAANLN
ncbi:MAG TPA: hypothetical protein VMM38_10635 [Aridibacter sp.]|nr:hypothetical protein [Aridibacter sp.]